MKQVIILFFLLITFGIKAVTINVPEDYETIQSAIDVAVDGDSVLVATGIYVENINFNGKGITVGSWFCTTQDTSYISQTIINRDISVSIAVFENGEDSSSVLSGFTLTDGWAVNGGAIYCTSSSPSLEHLIIEYNMAYYGGGVSFCDNSNPILESVIIRNNQANYDAGGMECDNSSPILLDVEIKDNSSRAGGGIYCINNSCPELDKSIISNNSAISDGGGIYCENSDPVIQETTIAGNCSDSNGGGIYCMNSNPELSHLSIRDNTADAGGGIALYGYTTPFLESLVVENNSAESRGGGVYIELSDCTLDNVEMVNNTSADGGGLCIYYSSPDLVNILIAGNSAEIGGGISFHGSSSILENVKILNNSAIEDGGGISSRSYSYPEFENVTIALNSANRGGGLYLGGSVPLFNNENLCNIYLNNIDKSGYGSDIYSSGPLDVIVDTFTVINPTAIHAYPFYNSNFDIQHSKLNQVSTDLYISPEGDNLNSGLSVEYPLKTIRYASLIILGDSLNPVTMHLAEGVYSNTSNAESFPVCLTSYVSLSGLQTDIVILNAENTAGVINCNVTENVTISDLTITGGLNWRGGGVICAGGSINFINITISDNTAENMGGGIYSVGSSISMNNILLQNNYAGLYGGGIDGNNTNFSGSNIIIENNTAVDEGGGIKLNECSVILDSFLVQNNYAGQNGGGIYGSDSILNGDNIKIRNNTAEADGGGLYWRSADNSLDYMEISGNTANKGGGIYQRYDDSRLNNILLADNIASEHGGAIYCSASSVIMKNMTITDNTAESPGGGICCENSGLIIINSILWNNSSEEIYMHWNYQEYNSVTICFSDIDGNQEAIVIEDGILEWLEGNICFYPSYVDAGDYHLNEDSPCIDAGIAYYEYEGEVLIDLSEDEYWGSAPDMGAYEYGLVEIEEDEIIIENEKLKIENYPNPFNPETRITFNLPETEHVNLSVYNLKGQLVKILADEILPAGNNSLIWDGRNKNGRAVGSGVYLVRMKSSNEVATKKVMLIK